MKLEVGKLYVCEKYFLMFYPDQETAASAAAAATGLVVSVVTDGAHFAAFWSDRLGKPVLFSEKNIPLLVLNSKDNCVEVLAGDSKGWIIFRDWLNLKEIM